MQYPTTNANTENLTQQFSESKVNQIELLLKTIDRLSKTIVTNVDNLEDQSLTDDSRELEYHKAAMEEIRLISFEINNLAELTVTNLQPFFNVEGEIRELQKGKLLHSTAE
ncbi:hypothetical protein [Chryseobacterium sp.]|uniref:hypothetical protein n=1 Tax=Chryseobacterium sp. TaxID=1871047 RepID=UPI0011CADBC1|nr:hypothetical protein [Chryseobacterium sp.]TXF75919.1 hypothetical protein FUA25_08420 [Chryseobacterium sp.]